MNKNMIYLVKLQKIDTTIERQQFAELEGPKKLEELDAELAQAESKVNRSLKLEEEQKKRRRELEKYIEETETNIKKAQNRQFQVKTNEEYKALLKEIDYQKREKNAAEDEVLQLMESLESLEEENKKLKLWLEEQKTILNQKKKAVGEWVEASKKDLQKNIIERESLIKDLPKDLLATYQRVYTRGNGRAVVPIIDGICQECHLQIPPQHFNELRRNDKLMSCPNCNRIIYWRDHEDYKNI